MKALDWVIVAAFIAVAFIFGLFIWASVNAQGG